jgi:cation transport regulator ChaC
MAVVVVVRPAMAHQEMVLEESPVVQAAVVQAAHTPAAGKFMDYLVNHLQAVVQVAVVKTPAHLVQMAVQAL